jgi:hypothetical protein
MSQRDSGYDRIEHDEEWRHVVGWPGYEVSDKGNVRSFNHAWFMFDFRHKGPPIIAYDFQ